MPSLKLLKFPGPMDRGGRDNVAGLMRGVRRGQVNRVLCLYQDRDGTVHWFRNNMDSARAVAFCENMKRQILAETFT